MQMAQLEHRHISKKNEARRQSNKVQVSRLETDPETLVRRAVSRNASSPAEEGMFLDMLGMVVDDLAEAS